MLVNQRLRFFLSFFFCRQLTLALRKKLLNAGLWAINLLNCFAKAQILSDVRKHFARHSVT